MKRLTSIWVAERLDGSDWSFTTYGTRQAAVKLARVLSGVPSLQADEKWRAVQFVRAEPRHSAAKGRHEST